MRIAKTVRRDMKSKCKNSESGNDHKTEILKIKPVQIRGLPAVCDKTLVTYSDSGNCVSIATLDNFEIFEIKKHNEGYCATSVFKTCLEGQVSSVVVDFRDSFYLTIILNDGEIRLICIDQNRVKNLRSFSYTPKALGVTRKYIVVVKPEINEDDAELLVLRKNDAGIVERQLLTSSNVDVRVGKHDEILLADRGSGMLRWIDTARRRKPCNPNESDRPDPTRPDDNGPHPDHSGHGRCCQVKPLKCGCMHTCCCKSERPKPERPDPNRPAPGSEIPGGGGRPNPHDPNEGCIPGGEGEPEDCYVTVNNGVTIYRVNICDPSEPPCEVKLTWLVGKIKVLSNAVIATSQDKKNIAVLHKRTLKPVYHHRLLKNQSVVGFSKSNNLILLKNATNNIELFDPTPVISPGELELIAPSSFAMYHGTSPMMQRSAHIAPAYRNVMIIPALEPEQSYFSAGVEAFSEFYDIELLIQEVKDYFEEISYHKENVNQGFQVHFSWFGGENDTPDLYTGPPIRLPNKFKDYWGPSWDPGHISSAVPNPNATLNFSGDESLTVKAIPAPKETYVPKEFTIRFPAANYQRPIPNSLPTISLSSSTTPSRTVQVEGTDRSGNMFIINVNTSSLSNNYSIDLTRISLEANTLALDQMSDMIQELLDNAPGSAGIFEKPVVTWQDDGNDTGMINVSLSFAAAVGNDQPMVTSFNLDGLFTELGIGGSLAANFVIPGDEGNMQVYLARQLTETVVLDSDFGSDFAESYFQHSDSWGPSVKLEDNQLKTRINLSTKHGRFPAKIERVSQTGLAGIGMDNPQEEEGADTDYSGGGGPKLADGNNLFADAYTAMIDAAIDQRGNEESVINSFNRRFHCVEANGESVEGLLCTINQIDCFVVTPVYATSGGTNRDPDLILGERANASYDTLYDKKAKKRAKQAMPIEKKGTVVTRIAPGRIVKDKETGKDDPLRWRKYAATLAHELGHALLDLKDLYEGGKYREGVDYVRGHCLMGESGSFAHFCAYYKRTKGWLKNDATLVLDRPGEDNPIDREIVLHQLEYLNPIASEDDRKQLAAAHLRQYDNSMPVVGAAFLRLGGDGRQFDILELRGKGDRFSQNIDPTRVLITNAIDPEDDTRYAENEVENAGTTRGVLERYRRKVHLLSSGLRDPAVDNVYNFASDPVFPEVGLQVELLELVDTGNQGELARVRIQWERGKAIDLGFEDSTPDWQSQDIAVIKPEEYDVNGNFDFPETQIDKETFRVPNSKNKLLHKIAARVSNFGDAVARNVQVKLILRRPGGAGDWKQEFAKDEIIAEVPPSSDSGKQMVVYDWEVTSDVDTHVCFRTEIGDRDVPRDNNGLALASDNTSGSNSWAQQNAFIFEAPSDSPPDPVHFTFQVQNNGSYYEEVHLMPRGLGVGSTMKIEPSKMRIAPFSNGLFKVTVTLEEFLLKRNCGKDIIFLLEAWRKDDDSEERWGSAKYIIKPRKRTKISLDGYLIFDKLSVSGSVSPDVGAQKILLQVLKPDSPAIWEKIDLGPASTFDYEMIDDFPVNQTVKVTAYYDGSYEFSKSVSDTLDLIWIPEG